jgi:hypothetical protein
MVFLKFTVLTSSSSSPPPDPNGTVRFWHNRARRIFLSCAEMVATNKQLEE